MRCFSVFDETDETYLSALDDYNVERSWRLVLAALDVELIDQNKNVISDYNQKKNALIRAGITSVHVQNYFQRRDESLREGGGRNRFFVRRAAGIDAKIEARLILTSRAKNRIAGTAAGWADRAGAVHALIEHYHMSPAEAAGLHRHDVAYLLWRITAQQERTKEKPEKPDYGVDSETAAKLPQQLPRKRGRRG